MWFTPEHFDLCNQLKQSGLAPRFEAGDIVARGFADLGSEEFQVLPGNNLLSLTAGTVKPLPFEHRDYFFWIPSVDEAVDLIEAKGYEINHCSREEMRDWSLVLSSGQVSDLRVVARELHIALLKALLAVFQRS
jgi:hypothetical protein